MANGATEKAFRPLMTGRALGLLIATVGLAFATASVSHTFLSSYTMFVLSRQMAFSILIALAQAVCLVVGGMNMSVGAIGSMATVIMGICFQNLGLNAWLAVPIVLLFGLIAGLINGLIITKLKINSFIVTLSTMFVYMGLRSGISGGSPLQHPRRFRFYRTGKHFGCFLGLCPGDLNFVSSCLHFLLNYFRSPITGHWRQRKCRAFMRHRY